MLWGWMEISSRGVLKKERSRRRGNRNLKRIKGNLTLPAAKTLMMRQLKKRKSKKKDLKKEKRT